MKKRWMSAAAAAMVLMIGATSAVAWGGQSRYIDANGDGVCDNRTVNWVDANGDGICDNRGTNGQGEAMWMQTAMACATIVRLAAV